MSAYASVGYSRWILTYCHLKNLEIPTFIRLKMFQDVSFTIFNILVKHNETSFFAVLSW